MAQTMALGVDLGWVSQLEQRGFRWVEADGRAVDPIRACRDRGATAVRLRLFVEPAPHAYWQKKPDELCMLGLCDTENVLAMAKRAAALGMDVMLDFHYSDHFADPLLQDMPTAWRGLEGDALVRRLYQYTCDTLARFKEAGIAPRWVQVGNEINPGVALPGGSLRDAPAQMVALCNAGYDAVKAVFPQCLVVTHLSGALNEAMCRPFCEAFFPRGGKCDVLAFSYYPYWAGAVSDRAGLLAWLKTYQKYGKPLMIAEVGGPDDDEQGAAALIEDCIEAMRAVGGLGVFYWEPDANRAAVPDGYPLGAARLVDAHTLQYTSALDAFRRP